MLFMLCTYVADDRLIAMEMVTRAFQQCTGIRDKIIGIHPLWYIIAYVFLYLYEQYYTTIEKVESLDF